MYVVQDARFVKEIRGKGIGVKGGGDGVGVKGHGVKG